MDIKRQIRDDRLKLAVLLFQAFHPTQIRDLKTGILGLPLVDGGVAYVVLAAEFCCFDTSISFFEYGNDLFFGVALLGRIRVSLLCF